MEDLEEDWEEVRASERAARRMPAREEAFFVSLSSSPATHPQLKRISVPPHCSSKPSRHGQEKAVPHEHPTVTSLTKGSTYLYGIWRYVSVCCRTGRCEHRGVSTWDVSGPLHSVAFLSQPCALPLLHVRVLPADPRRRSRRALCRSGGQGGTRTPLPLRRTSQALAPLSQQTGESTRSSGEEGAWQQETSVSWLTRFLGS